MKIDWHSGLPFRLLTFFGPIVLSVLGILVLYSVLEYSVFSKLFFLMTVYFIPPLGKESVIPIGIAGGNLTMPFSDEVMYITPIDPFVMAIAIAFVDVMVALFLVWNYDLIKYIPVLGDVVKRVEEAGAGKSSKYAWIKPLEFIGIVLFVIVPFQGSGGFFGSVVGRLIGMKPWRVWTAIVIGSFLSTFMVAYFSSAVYALIIENFLLGLGVLGVVALVLVGVWFFRKKKQRNAQGEYEKEEK